MLRKFNSKQPFSIIHCHQHTCFWQDSLSIVSIFLAGENQTALNKSKIDPLTFAQLQLEALYHLIRKCLYAIVNVKATDFFHPFQFGVACPFGAEKNAHGLRACIEEHWGEDDFAVLKIDMKNGFNVVSQQSLLSECAKHFPELLPWASRCYGHNIIFGIS